MGIITHTPERVNGFTLNGKFYKANGGLYGLLAQAMQFQIVTELAEVIEGDRTNISNRETGLTRKTQKRELA